MLALFLVDKVGLARRIVWAEHKVAATNQILAAIVGDCNHIIFLFLILPNRREIGILNDRIGLGYNHLSSVG